MNIDSVIDKNISHVPEDMDLGALVHAISRSHTTILPVLDEGGKFMGEIDMSKLRHISTHKTIGRNILIVFIVFLG